MKISKTSLAERMIALLLAAAVVVSAIPIGALRVSAATLVQLSGSVMDQVTGSGIADVTVTLTSETSDAVVEGTQTDANGAYAVNLTAGAAYTVSFSKEGYKGNQIAYTGAIRRRIQVVWMCRWKKRKRIQRLLLLCQRRMRFPMEQIFQTLQCRRNSRM